MTDPEPAAAMPGTKKRIPNAYADDALRAWAKKTPGADYDRAAARLDDLLKPIERAIGLSEWNELIDQVKEEMEPVAPQDGGEIGAFKALRLQGATEAKALETVPIGLRETLAARGLLDEWPIGWTEAESAKLAEHLTFDDVIARVSRVVDLPRDKLVLGVLLSAQGHLAPLLRAIGPAIHAIPVAPRFSAGKTRTAHALTILADGRWTDSATVPYLKSARKDGPRVLGIDEGDEAEKDSPGVKAYLLISHNWDAVYGKFSDPDEEGHRELEDIRYGGPVFLTFRKRPWPALESRSVLFEIEPSHRTSVSDDGAGDGLRALLLAPALWLRLRCAEGSREWDSMKALARIHDPSFLRVLDRVTKGLPILRQRDKARTLLFIAERLGIDLSTEIEAALREEEVESENATVIEAIERDSVYRYARDDGPDAEVVVEELRLRVQKDLKDHREPRTLTRNGFAAVLAEMGFSKLEGPTWKRSRRSGQDAVVVLPGLLKGSATGATGATGTSGEAGSTGGTGSTPYGGHQRGLDSKENLPESGSEARRLAREGFDQGAREEEGDP